MNYVVAFFACGISKTVAKSNSPKNSLFSKKRPDAKGVEFERLTPKKHIPSQVCPLFEMRENLHSKR